MRIELRVLIVSEHASTRFGGEAILPWHYFRILRQRGIDAWLISHERTREELLDILPAEVDRMHFMADTFLNKFTYRIGRLLPHRVAYFTVGYVRRVSNQRAARNLARRLVREHGINIVHQPIPVSPREPSLMYDVGAPVIIGPMNGNMQYPPGIVHQTKSHIGNLVPAVGRSASNLLNRLFPGKIYASALLVANGRTREALPRRVRGDVVEIVENGVDLSLWAPISGRTEPEITTKFVYMGRLVDWKAVDILLRAFSQISATHPVSLELIGDGPMRRTWERLATHLGIEDCVSFTGWLSQTECAVRLKNAHVLVLPSLFECGGAVVLEAMACGLPVVATNWGGPADYLDSTCGILVSPISYGAMVNGFAQAMAMLANKPSLRARMGESGRRKVEREYDWAKKVDMMLEIYARYAQTESTSHSEVT